MLRFNQGLNLIKNSLGQAALSPGTAVGLAVYFSTVVSLAAAVDIWLLQLDLESRQILPHDSHLPPNGF